MATKKIVKSKATSPKSRTSSVAPVKKTVAKTAAKGKTASAKSRPASKSSPAGKAKKSTPVAKSKPAPKVAAKPTAKVVKPAAKKVAPVKPSVKAKAGPPAKKVVKAQPKPAAKPVAKAKPAPVKSGARSVTAKDAHTKKPAAKPVTPVKAASKPAVKPVAPAKVAAKPTSKPVAPVKATAKPALKPVPQVKAASKPVAKNPIPEAKVPTSQPEVKTRQVEKPAAKSQPKESVPVQSPVAKNTGSKSSDLATKPKSAMENPKESSKEAAVKPAKPTPVHTAKTFEKMSDKKEHKSVSATASAEEPHKTRYNDKELEEFDQLIDQKLIVAREQLEFYLKQLEDMAENPDNKIKGLDDGLSSLESERVSSMAARQQKLIQHLENAKIRIRNKVYGICRETGKLISKERLRAVPHATLSIEAKQAQN